MTAALVAASVLAIACVAFVAWPFLREPAPRDDRLRTDDALTRRRIELTEERDRALAALKELEFDHRTGKISDEDYRVSLGPLRQRAADVLRSLELRSDRPSDQTAVTAPRDRRPLESQEVDG